MGFSWDVNVIYQSYVLTKAYWNMFDLTYMQL